MGLPIKLYLLLLKTNASEQGGEVVDIKNKNFVIDFK